MYVGFVPPSFIKVHEMYVGVGCVMSVHGLGGGVGTLCVREVSGYKVYEGNDAITKPKISSNEKSDLLSHDQSGCSHALIPCYALPKPPKFSG